MRLKYDMSDPWYIKSFQDDYLKIYSHRTDEAAKEEVNQITSLLNMETKKNVLDLCCGNGRHSRQLAKLGYQVTGIDLSTVLLQEAEQRNDTKAIRYLHRDVRDLPFKEEFDYVLNLFTSFGYFEQVEENMKVFTSIYNSLKQDGKFLIDFLNPGYVKNTLVPYSERTVDDLLVIEKRRIEGKKVCKDIEIHQGEKIRIYQEQVNLFEYEEMESMIGRSGLEVTQVYGDFKQQTYDELESPRMIIIGKK
jgi:SAM-dependent methyltransferase